MQPHSPLPERWFTGLLDLPTGPRLSSVMPQAQRPLQVHDVYWQLPATNGVPPLDQLPWSPTDAAALASAQAPRLPLCFEEISNWVAELADERLQRIAAAAQSMLRLLEEEAHRTWLQETAVDYEPCPRCAEALEAFCYADERYRDEEFARTFLLDSVRNGIILRCAAAAHLGVETSGAALVNRCAQLLSTAALSIVDLTIISGGLDICDYQHPALIEAIAGARRWLLRVIATA